MIKRTPRRVVVDVPGLFACVGDRVRVDGYTSGDYIGIVTSVQRGDWLDVYGGWLANRRLMTVLVDRWVGEGTERLFEVVATERCVVEIIRRA